VSDHLSSPKERNPGGTIVLPGQEIFSESSFEEKMPGRRASRRIWSPLLPVQTGCETQTKTGNVSKKKLEQLLEKGTCESSGL